VTLLFIKQILHTLLRFPTAGINFDKVTEEFDLYWSRGVQSAHPLGVAPGVAPDSLVD